MSSSGVVLAPWSAIFRCRLGPLRSQSLPLFGSGNRVVPHVGPGLAGRLHRRRRCTVGSNNCPAASAAGGSALKPDPHVAGDGDDKQAAPSSATGTEEQQELQQQAVALANGSAAASLAQPSQPSPEVTPTQPPVLIPEAYQLDWDFVTFRGCSDGETVIYKFGAADERLRLAWGPARYIQREANQPSWSNAVRLWVKKGTTVELSLRKLEQYVEEYRQTGASSVLLDHQLYRTYDEVLATLEERLEEAREWEVAQQRQRQQQQGPPSKRGSGGSGSRDDSDGGEGPPWRRRQQARQAAAAGPGGSSYTQRWYPDDYGTSDSEPDWERPSRRRRRGGEPPQAAQQRAGPAPAQPQQQQQQRQQQKEEQQEEEEAPIAAMEQQGGGAAAPQPELAPALGREPQQPSQPAPLQLDPSAYSMGWDYCTVRGWRDGTLLFKFGVLDTRQELLHPDLPPEQIESVSWSCAVKLGAKKASTLEITLRKLDAIMRDYVQRGASAQALNHPMHRTWEDMVQYAARKLGGKGGGGGASGAPDAEPAAAAAGEQQAVAAAAAKQREEQAAATAAAGAAAVLSADGLSELAAAESAAAAGMGPATEAVSAAAEAASASAGLAWQPLVDWTCWWDYCTIRGWEDGSLVYKFGTVDLAPPYVQQKSRQPASEANSTDGEDNLASQQEEELQQQQQRDDGSAAAQLASEQQQGDEGEQQQQQLGGEEAAAGGPSWSNALWLAVKPSSHLLVSHRKLSRYAEDFATQQYSSTVLTTSLHRTYPKAHRKLQEWRSAQQAQQAQQALAGPVGGNSGGGGPAGVQQEWAAKEAGSSAAEPQQAAVSPSAPSDGLSVSQEREEVGRGARAGTVDGGEASAAGLGPLIGSASEAGPAALPLGRLAEVAESEQVQQQQQQPLAGDGRLPEQQRLPLGPREGERRQWRQAEQEQQQRQQWREAGRLEGARMPAAGELQAQRAWSPAKRVAEAEEPGARRLSDAPLHDASEPAPKSGVAGLLAALAGWALAVKRWCQSLVCAPAATLAAAFAATLRLLPLQMLLNLVAKAVPVPLLSRWPPKIRQLHVSPSVTAMILALRDRSGNRPALEASGYDTGGKTTTPLADLPAWRVSQLTGAPVRSLDLYIQALTHLTALPHSRKTSQSYERLEWLGDSVLELITRRLLMEKYPGADEGQLSRLCQALVSGRRATEFAKFLGLERWLVMAAFNMRDGLAHTPAVLADVFEALVGALYLDQGYSATERFVLRVLDSCIDWQELAAGSDHRTTLARYALSQRLGYPRFVPSGREWRPIKDTGMMREYMTVEVLLNGRVLGSGTHWEKCFAERQAAKQALQALGLL